MIWQPSTGIWTPPRVGPLPIPPSPPAERRIREEREIRRQIMPIRCPGIAPAAWRESEQIALPMGIAAQRIPLKPMVAAGPSITAPSSFWRLSDTADSAGSNTLTNNGSITFSTGKIGDAAYFPSDNTKYLSHASNTGLQTGAVDWWAACWFYPADTTTNYGIIGKDSPSGDGLEWRLKLNAVNGAVQLNTNDSHVAVSGTTATATAWNCALVWHDSSSGSIFCKLNNGATGTFNPAASTANGSPFVIGGNFSFVIALNGRVDAVGWWKGHYPTTAEQDGFWNSGNGTEWTGTAWTP